MLSFDTVCCQPQRLRKRLELGSRKKSRPVPLLLDTQQQTRDLEHRAQTTLVLLSYPASLLLSNNIIQSSRDRKEWEKGTTT